MQKSNKRGVYSPDAGKSEKEIANKYYKFSKALEIDYPITADIFYELGKSYDEESLQQRMLPKMNKKIKFMREQDTNLL